MVIITTPKGEKYTRHLRLVGSQIVGVDIPETYRAQSERLQDNPNTCAGLSARSELMEPYASYRWTLEVPVRIWDSILGKDRTNYLKERILNG